VPGASTPSLIFSLGQQFRPHHFLGFALIHIDSQVLNAKVFQFVFGLGPSRALMMSMRYS